MSRAARPRSCKISEEEWEKHREVIISVYQSGTLGDVVRTLSAAPHHFLATRSQYPPKLQEWGVSKYISSAVWPYIGQQLKRRREAAKESEVVINGIRIPPGKVRKETSRYAAHQMGMQSVIPPENVLIRTPPLAFLSIADTEGVAAVPEDKTISLTGDFAPSAAFDDAAVTQAVSLQVPAISSPLISDDPPWDTLILRDSHDPQPSSDKDILPNSSGEMWNCLGLSRKTLGPELTSFVKVVFDTPTTRTIPFIARELWLWLDKQCYLDSEASFRSGLLKVAEHLPLSLGIGTSNSHESTRESNQKIEDLSGYQPSVDQYVNYYIKPSLETLPWWRGLWVVSEFTSVVRKITFVLHRLANNMVDMEFFSHLQHWIRYNYTFVQQLCVSIKGPSKNLLLQQTLLSIDTAKDIEASFGLHSSAIFVNDAVFLDHESLTLLQVAVKMKKVHLARLLLEHRMGNANYTRAKTPPPLHFAIACQDLTLVDVLLNNMASALPYQFRSASGKFVDSNPLTRAVMTGSAPIVSALLRAGAMVNAVDSECGPPLSQATRRGDHNLVRMLLWAEADVNWPHGSQSPLPSICLSGYWEQGADKGLNISYRSSALQNAIQFGHQEITDALLAAGAAINARIAAPFVEDASVIRYEMADYFKRHHTWPIMTPLQAAVTSSQSQFVEFCLSKTVDVGARAYEDYDDTPLQIAARMGNFDAVGLLIGSKADVNAPPGKYRGSGTALQLAAKHGNYEIATSLVAAGADINAPPSDCNGLTALQAAVSSGHLDLVIDLIRLGAHVNAPHSPNGGKPCILAMVESDHASAQDQLLGLLVSKKADLNSCPSPLEHPALVAAEKGNFQLVRKLLELGSCPNVPNPSQTGLRRILKFVHTVRQQDWYATCSFPLLISQDHVLRIRIAGSTFVWAYNLPISDDLFRASILEREWELIYSAIGAKHFQKKIFENYHVRFLVAAAGVADLDVVESLLQKDSEVWLNQQGIIFEKTVLSKSTDDRIVLVAKKLLSTVLKRNRRPQLGRSLQFASEERLWKTVRTLLSYGGDPNPIHLTNSNTPLVLAIVDGRPDLAFELLGWGAKVDGHVTQYGFNHHLTRPLERAATLGDASLVKMLISLGADVNWVDAGFRTALWAAAGRGDLVIARMLLQAGSVIYDPKIGLRTAPLYAAAEHGRLDMVHLLLRNSSGISSQHLVISGEKAREEGFSNVARYIKHWDFERQCSVMDIDGELVVL